MNIKPANFREEGEGIYYVEDNIVQIGSEWVNFLKGQVGSCSKKRNRICSHVNTDDQLHEMLICVMAGSYTAPAKHIKKAESLHVIEGTADIVFFDADGNIDEVTELTEPTSSGKFYYRMNQDIYHMLIVRSEFFVFHEATLGPFDRSSTVFPDWAPEENNHREVLAFLQKVEKEIDGLKGGVKAL